MNIVPGRIKYLQLTNIVDQCVLSSRRSVRLMDGFRYDNGITKLRFDWIESV